MSQRKIKGNKKLLEDPTAYSNIPPALHRSQSCSSLCVESTITDPLLSDILYSVSKMIFCQLIRDQASVSSKRATMLSYFCESTYSGKVVKSVPRVKAIHQFLTEVFEVGQFRAPFAIVMFIYVNRLIGITGIALVPNNWCPIVISALCLAQKVWDDTPLVNADFTILYPLLSVKQFNFLEFQLLNLLEFKLSVSSCLYAQYYFELRRVVADSRPIKTAAAMVDRLTYLQLRQDLRARLTANYCVQRKTKERAKESLTVEDISYIRGRFVIS